MTKGTRVELRPVGAGDVEIVHAYAIANREFLAPWEPQRSEADFDAHGVRDRLEEVDTDRRDDRAYAYGVFESASGELVGRLNLSNVVRGAWENCTLGYSVGRSFNGRGFATEAVGLAVHIAFEDLGLHRVQAATLPRNGASIRVLEKNCFRDEGIALHYLKIAGVWEDHRVFALTREETDSRS